MELTSTWNHRDVFSIVNDIKLDERQKFSHLIEIEFNDMTGD